MSPPYPAPHGGDSHGPSSLDQLKERFKQVQAEADDYQLKHDHKATLGEKLKASIDDIVQNVEQYETVVGGQMQGVVQGKRFHELKEHYRKSLECVVHHLGGAKVEAVRRAIHGEVLEPIGSWIAKLVDAEKKLFGVYEANTLSTADAAAIAWGRYKALSFEELLRRNKRIAELLEFATDAQGDTTGCGDERMREAYAYLWLAKQWIKRVVVWNHLTIDIADFCFPDPDDYEPWLIRAYLKWIRLQEAADAATQEQAKAKAWHEAGLKTLGELQNLETFELNVREAAKESGKPHPHPYPPHGHGHGSTASV